MYVCICNGITEEMLETAVKQGQSEKDILNRLGVGNSCGVCLIDAINNIKSSTKANTQVKKSETKSRS